MPTPEMQALAAELQTLRQELVRQQQDHSQELERARPERARTIQEATQAAQGSLGIVPKAVQEMGRALQGSEQGTGRSHEGLQRKGSTVLDRYQGPRKAKSVQRRS